MRILHICFRIGAIIWAVFGVAAAQAAEANTVLLFDGRNTASVICDSQQPAPIAKAAQLLVSDMGKLTGKVPRLLATSVRSAPVAVLIGLANSPGIAAILRENRISMAPIDGKWESYGRVAVPAPGDPNRTLLVIFGSDVRGTIWGVIDLTREMGVSAWEWWGDANIRRVSRLAADSTLRYSKEPTVKYRGIFLNDEDWGLHPWASETFDPKTHDIGPKTYARVFELMWRLKANTIWPAMHDVTQAFNKIPGNAEIAASYAIIHGSSHAEPMLRDNVREWDGKKMGDFNYVTNKARILAYWGASVDENKAFENIYTVGMRGVHDSPMQGATGGKAASQLLQQVIADQRHLLQTYLEKPAEAIPQIFVPYKEVLAAYDAGLDLPDDVTIVWPDDNYGYIRRLSNWRERARSGGSGVYYHLSYWGAPMSYLWLATTHPALIWEEMDKAYQFGAKRIWIANVGDIKPAEYLTQLFLDMAFDKDAFPDIGSVRAHLRNWMQGQFGPAHAAELADIMWRYYDLAFTRRPEFMGWNEIYPSGTVHETQFNMTDFGDENARRLRAYRELAARVDTVARGIAADRKDAFFELVQYPVEAAATMNERVLDTDKALTYGLQHRASANMYASRARAAQKRIENLTLFYNNAVAHGKWRLMMDAAPQRLAQFGPQMVPEWKLSRSRACGLAAEGGSFYTKGVDAARLPTFHHNLPRTRYLEVFSKGGENLSWTAKARAPWIKLSQTAGRLTPRHAETRLLVGIDWSKAPQRGKGSISIACGGEIKPMVADVQISPLPAGASFVEDDRIVSIYAVHPDAQSRGWQILDGLGQTSAVIRSVFSTPSISAGDKAALQTAPSLTYSFATITDRDPATLEIVALPVAPVTSQNGMRVAVSIDDGAPEVMDLSSNEFSQTWRRNVLGNTSVATLTNLRLAKGAHKLMIVALDPGVALERVLIAFAGANNAYGAAPETRVAH